MNEPEPSESPASSTDLSSELSSRLTVLEGRVRSLEDRLEDVRRDERSRKQRALLWRMLLLAVLLGGYFFLRTLRS